MSFLPSTSTEWWSIGTALGVTALMLAFFLPRLYPKARSSNSTNEAYKLKLVEWERDRAMTLAKGVAGTAATYFAALIPPILKGPISLHVSGLSVTGTAVGFLGALFLAGDITAATRKFTWDNPP